MWRLTCGAIAACSTNMYFYLGRVDMDGRSTTTRLQLNWMHVNHSVAIESVQLLGSTLATQRSAAWSKLNLLIGIPMDPGITTLASISIMCTNRSPTIWMIYLKTLPRTRCTRINFEFGIELNRQMPFTRKTHTKFWKSNAFNSSAQKYQQIVHVNLFENN